jgi:hypothetical protein
MLTPNRCIAASLSLDVPIFKNLADSLRGWLLYASSRFLIKHGFGKILLQLLQNQ